MNRHDTPSWLKGGKLDLFEGAYSCIDPKGSNTQMRVSVVLKDGRVAQFMMGPMK